MTTEIIYDMTYAEYEALPQMRPSTLKHGRRSMKRLKRALDGECQPNKDTVAVGNATHCLLAGELEDRYAVMPAFEKDEGNVTKTGKPGPLGKPGRPGRPSTSKGTNYYKSCVEEWEIGNTKEVLNEAQVATASKIANLVRKKFGSLIDSSRQEVVLTGVIQGVPVKTRLDGLVIEDGLIWDLKTTGDIADAPFYRTVKKLDYLFSACIHWMLLLQNGIVLKRYSYLAAEVGGDYDVREIDVPLLAIECKDQSVLRVISDYKHAMKTNVWPGIPDGPLMIPNWDMEEEEEPTWEGEHVRS